MATFSNTIISCSKTIFEAGHKSKNRTVPQCSGHLTPLTEVSQSAVAAPGLASEVLSKLSRPCLVLLTYSRLPALLLALSVGLPPALGIAQLRWKIDK